MFDPVIVAVIASGSASMQGSGAVDREKNIVERPAWVAHEAE